jgi:hypothetical protein
MITLMTSTGSVGADAVEAAVVPGEGITRLAGTSGFAFVTIESDECFEMRERWSEETGRSVLEALGQAGGQPDFGGGGCDYGFRCGTCAGAAFLWQR